MQKIIIIEDELAISQVLKVYLTKLNFEVVQVFSGHEALAIFKREQPDCPRPRARATA